MTETQGTCEECRRETDDLAYALCGGKAMNLCPSCRARLGATVVMDPVARPLPAAPATKAGFVWSGFLVSLALYIAGAAAWFFGFSLLASEPTQIDVLTAVVSILAGIMCCGIAALIDLLRSAVQRLTALERQAQSGRPN